MKEEVLNQDEIFDKLMIIYKYILDFLDLKIRKLKDNNIETIKKRIKTYESIHRKMEYKGYELTYQEMIKNIKDIAGLRIICNSTTDVYSIAENISTINDLEILEKKDYITHPKKSGYQSYHLIVLIPIKIKSYKFKMYAEIQIRTVCMDSWANIAHELKYKPKL